MITECRCPLCGKNFIPAPCHIYKDNGKIFCSWSCYNHRNDGKQGKKCNVIEQYTSRGGVIRTYQSATQAAFEMDGTADCIRTACRKCTFYKGFLWRYKK